MSISASPRAALVALLIVLSPSCGTPSNGPVPEASAAPPPVNEETLAFSIDTGDLDNHFFREGAIAAHVLAASGRFPRILFALPAGDSGAGLWFEDLVQPARLAVLGPVEPAESSAMRGVTVRIRIDAPLLRVRGAVLGSIRALRQYTSAGTVPAGFENRIERGRTVLLSRTMLDGHRISLALTPEGGAHVDVDAQGRITAAAAPGETGFVLQATALTDEPPLSPIGATSLLNASAVRDPQSRDALAFLSYDEKLLAGSWRFLTYFGRDTLISLDMLMSALTPEVIEAGLGSVIERLGASGEVAHEEAIGEWAVLENRAHARPGDPRAPVLDYSMVDGDFLLAPALARYLLEDPDGRERASAFLARRTAAGLTYREAVRKNLARVLALAAPFALSQSPSDLIALKPGTHAGNWRDSGNGLGGGRVPYDVNVALVPAALEAAARLYESASLHADPEAAAIARQRADVWRDAASLFRVEVPEADARARVAAFATAHGLDPAAALSTIHGPVVFDAVALDASFAPIPVLNTDVGFRWLYDTPPSDEVERTARRIVAPFPAGLFTPVGVFVANPAFAGDPVIRSLFTGHDYHGTVVWSWQQALLAAGIDRQLARADLAPAARRALEDAEVALWKVIRGTQAIGMGTAELWSFRVDDGRFVLVPFGEGHGDADESNAVQLWSTVYLSVRPSWDLRQGRDRVRR
ncbi:Glycogen debranching enzyme [Minicystis rosea]|nr:Glycogen debranching enzyme [Minicystis rosea]